MAFPSVYEMTNPLTTVRKQHFWEYFSGVTIISNGVEWQNMTDGQSASGNRLTKSGTNWTADATGTRTFSSSVGAEVEFTVSQNTSDSFCGFDISTNTDSYNMDYALYCGGGGTINIYANGSQVSATGVSYTTADRLGVKMNSSGTVTFLKNGAVFYTSSTTASGTYRVNAVIYTSGVSLTVNMNSRWATINPTGTGTFGMVDDVDGGFSVQSATSGYAKSAIYFDNKRQFKGGGSVCIGSMKNSVAGGGAYGYMGLSTVGYDTGDFAYMGKPDNANNTKFVLATSSGSSPETTANASTTVTQDTSFHTFKMVLSASNVVGTIDGVLASTNSTSIPTETEKLQPTVLNMNNNSGSGNVTSIKYMECYNT